jgi:acyl-CoA synthetase (NDP forming)
VPVDVSGRALELAPAGLERFFAPRRVAVLGASDTEGRPTTLYWRMLRDWGGRVGAEVVPVNPNRSAVDGVVCAATLEDVPAPLDVVAVLIGDALAGVRAAAARSAAFAVVFSAGFAETGAAGRAAQAALVAAARAGGTRLLGPNTNLNAFERFRTDLPGPALGVITQSGHQGRPLFQLQENGVRVAAWAPTGNEADLDLADFLAHFADLSTAGAGPGAGAGPAGLGAVAAYVEGFRDGRAFQLAADRCARAGLPVVAVKVGRSEVGRRGVGTHTGKLAGSDRVTGAVLRQLGVTRVDGLDELGATASFLARANAVAGRPKAGGGVVVYSISGGTGAHLSDLLAAGGVPLRRLSAATRRRLRDWIPSDLGVDNPVDCGGPPVGDERGPAILDALVADPATAALLVAVAGPFPPLSDRLAADVVALAERTDVPVCVLWGSPTGTEPALRDVLLASPRVTVFRTAGSAVGALRAWFDWHRFRDGYRSPFAAAPRRRSAAAAVADRTVPGLGAADGPTADPVPTHLSEHEAKGLLAAYGIPVTEDRLAGSPAEAVAAAAALAGDGPVVLKACGRAFTHKSDHGLVIAGVVGPDAVRAAHRTLVERAEAVAPGALDGVLVCPQEPPGCELVLGVADDAVFGPVVLAGLGGVLVEVLEDVGVAVPPFTDADAGRVLDGLRGAAVLRGVRGAPLVDRRAVVQAMLRLQRLALEQSGRVASVDVNPLVARARGRGVVALDALVALRPGGGR